MIALSNTGTGFSARRRSVRHGWVTLFTGLSLLFASMLSGAHAFAGEKLGTPDQLVQKASEGRAQFFEVLRDLDAYLPELRSRSASEPYLFMMADLEQVSKTLKLDELASSAFGDTALRITQHSMRWLQIDKDSLETVLKYHRYADESTAYEVVERTQETLRAAAPTNPALLVSNLVGLETWATQRKMASYLIAGYRELRGNVAALVLKDAYSLSGDEQSFWLSHLASNTALASFLADQQRIVLATTAKDKEQLHAIASLLVKTQGALASQPYQIQDYLVSQLGDLSRELITRFLRFEVPFAAGEFDALASLLQSAQLQALSYTLTDVNRRPSASYIPSYLGVAQKTVALLDANGLYTERDTLKKYLETLAGQYSAATKSLEGTYRLRTDDGRYWRFTLVFASSERLVAGLAQEKHGFVDYAYYNIGFDVATQTYTASELDPTEVTSRNSTLKFAFDGQGGISGEMFNVKPSTNGVFKGTKTEDYRDFLNDTSLPSLTSSIDGTYSGVLNCEDKINSQKGRLKIPVSLTVTTVNNSQIGRLSFKNDNFSIDLSYGLRQPLHPIVYLTSGRMGMRSFVHFRGVVEGDTLVGDYIVGGQGVYCRNVQLKKVK